MTIIDTHVWLWLATNASKISSSALKKLEDSDQIGVCAISCWEIAMLVSKERLALKYEVQEWINEALQLPKIKLVPLSPVISVLATRLPGDIHGDSADRIIVASSLELKATLITKDQRILNYKFVDSFW